MLSVDLSGLESLLNTVNDIQRNIPEIFASFLKSEFGKFIESNASNPDFPYKTGDMLNSINMSYIRQSAGITEADWSFLVDYASYVNYGTSRITPQYFNEKAINEVELQQEQRFNDLLEKVFAFLLSHGVMPVLQE